MGTSIKKLTADQKEVAVKTLQKLSTATQTLNALIQDDILTYDMGSVLPNAMQLYMEDINEAIGYTGEKTESEKQMELSANQLLQQQVKDLKEIIKTLESGGEPSPVYLASIAEEWWQSQGFLYAEWIDADLETGDIVIQFNLLLRSFATAIFSKTPVSDKAKNEKRVAELKAKGFEITKSDEFLDTPKNVKLIEEIITKAIPSASIEAVSTSKLDNKIDTIDVRIKNKKDILHLKHIM